MHMVAGQSVSVALYAATFLTPLGKSRYSRASKTAFAPHGYR